MVTKSDDSIAWDERRWAMRPAGNSDAVGTRTTATRRQFAGAALGLAAGALAVPAVVRGRNLNEKLNIAMIGAGGRGGAEPQGRRVREHRGALRRVRPGRRTGRGEPSQGPPIPRLSPALRPRQRVRRRGREHDRAHPRLCHPAGLAAGQARLLREAADPQRLGGPRSSARPPPRPRWPPRWARRSTPATTIAAWSS